MFSLLINFLTIASVIGDIMGVTGTMSALAEIFLYQPKININQGVQLT